MCCVSITNFLLHYEFHKNLLGLKTFLHELHLRKIPQKHMNEFIDLHALVELTICITQLYNI